jgi:phosphoribosylaminoimidazole (AIR) synthetase
MGIGMVLVCAPADAMPIKASLDSCYEIGRVTTGGKSVSLV